MGVRKRPTKKARRRQTITAYTADLPLQGIPEHLLSEKEYGEQLAPLYDRLFPESPLSSTLEPFVSMLIRKHQIQRVCDIACRTGQVLSLFRQLGLKNLTGVDASLTMLKLTRKKNHPKMSLIEAELAQATSSIPPSSFDLIVCLRDALPVVLDDEALIDLFKSLRNTLSDKGIVLLEICNYQKIWRRKERFLPIIPHTEGKIQHLFFFMNDFHEELLVRNLMHCYTKRGQWLIHPLSIPIRPLLPAEIEFLLNEAAFSKWTFLGNYRGQRFIPDLSPHLIVVAQK